MIHENNGNIGMYVSSVMRFLAMWILLISIVGCVPEPTETLQEAKHTYSLSGVRTQDAPFVLDDELKVYVNGTRLHTISSTEGYSGPITLEAKRGDSMTLVASNTYLASPCAIGELYIRSPNGNAQQLTSGTDKLLCSNGIFWEKTVTLP